jgi:hypothetical protein
MLYFTDSDSDVFFSIFEESESKTKKILSFLAEAYGKEFEEISEDKFDEYTFETDTLIIESKYFIEELIELVELGVEIHII